MASRRAPSSVRLLRACVAASVDCATFSCAFISGISSMARVSPLCTKSPSLTRISTTRAGNLQLTRYSPTSTSPCMTSSVLPKVKKPMIATIKTAMENPITARSMFWCWLFALIPIGIYANVCKLSIVIFPTLFPGLPARASLRPARLSSGSALAAKRFARQARRSTPLRLP